MWIVNKYTNMSSENSSRFGSVYEIGLKDLVDDKDARCTKKAIEQWCT